MKATTEGDSMIWHLFYRSGERLLPVDVVIQKSSSVLLELREPTSGTSVPVTGLPRVGGVAGILHAAASRGVAASVVERDGTQAVVLDMSSAPVATDQLMRFFNPASAWDVPGGDELRRQYFKRLEVLELDPECPPCAHGALMREFMPQVEALLRTTYRRG